MLPCYTCNPYSILLEMKNWTCFFAIPTVFLLFTSTSFDLQTINFAQGQAIIWYIWCSCFFPLCEVKLSNQNIRNQTASYEHSYCDIFLLLCKSCGWYSYSDIFYWCLKSYDLYVLKLHYIRLSISVLFTKMDISSSLWYEWRVRRDTMVLYILHHTLLNI